MWAVRTLPRLAVEAGRGRARDLLARGLLGALLTIGEDVILRGKKAA
jgi:hypothetical protein